MLNMAMSSCRSGAITATRKCPDPPPRSMASQPVPPSGAAGSSRKWGGGSHRRPVPSPKRTIAYWVPIVEDGVWLPALPWIRLLPSEITEPPLILSPSVVLPVMTLW